jgi:adenylate cyclase
VRDLKEMKDSNNVDYALTGSVRFTSDKVRLNVQLILAENSEILWTESYQRQITSENIFDIQEEIVSQVLNSIADDNGILLKKNLFRSPSFTGFKNTEAGDAIFKYFDYSLDYNPEKFAIALNALERTVKSEPSNALATALLANAYFDVYCRNILRDDELLEKVIALAHSAVQADHYCQHAQRVLGWTLLVSGHRSKSLEVMDYAIQLNPKASGVVSSMALGFICLGEYSKGFKWLLESIHLNPVASAGTKLGFALYHFSSKEYTDVIKWLDQMELYEVPVIALLSLSAHGKLNKGKVKEIDQSLYSFGENTKGIIERFIPDNNLASDILDGLKLAGLTVK